MGGNCGGFGNNSLLIILLVLLLLPCLCNSCFDN